MIEKVGPIKNPLTIIAIFAAIAEISGTIVLPFIAPNNQATYVWFLIIFPILLIILFFLTLNFNHKVLYAPSDYQNEDNFLRSLPRATIAEKTLKIEAEIAEEAKTIAINPSSADPTKETQPSSAAAAKADDTSIASLFRRSPQATYVLAEEAIFRHLSREFGTQIQREVKVGDTGLKYIFDGIVRDKGITTAIEVKVLRDARMSGIQLRQSLSRIQEAVHMLPSEQTGNFRVLLALAFDGEAATLEPTNLQINRLRENFPFPIEVRYYKLEDLEREFSVAA